MKAWLFLAGYFLFGSSLLWPAVPQTRVVDDSNSLLPQVKMLLEDHLDSMFKTQQVDAYLVVLSNESTKEAGKLCDQWQAEWVPKGLGGVFVYCLGTKAFSFSATPETLERLEQSRLQKLFYDPLKNPLMGSSLDVEVSAPVFRVLTALGEERITYREKAMEAAEAEISQGKILLGMIGAFALAGWLLYLGKFVQGLRKGSIPSAGMAYGNPPQRRKSRRNSDPTKDRYLVRFLRRYQTV